MIVSELLLTFKADVFHHIALTKTGNTMSVFMDGEAQVRGVMYGLKSHQLFCDSDRKCTTFLKNKMIFSHIL